jgi:hypothetical protein
MEGKWLGRGALCQDCRETKGVQEAYDVLWVYRNQAETAWIYIYGCPVFVSIVVLGKYLSAPEGMLDFCTGLMTPLTLWFFYVIYWAKKLGIPRVWWVKWDKVEKAKEDLFIVKVAGERK